MKRGDNYMGDGTKVAIRHFRKLAGLTQEQAVEAYGEGMTQARDWSNLERAAGKVTLSEAELSKVGAVVEATPDQIRTKAAEIEAADRGSRM